MLGEKHLKWVQWLIVGPVGMRSPVLRSITAVFQQCVKIVGVLGEAAPMEHGEMRLCELWENWCT